MAMLGCKSGQPAVALAFFGIPAALARHIETRRRSVLQDH